MTLRIVSESHTSVTHILCSPHVLWFWVYLCPTIVGIHYKRDVQVSIILLGNPRFHSPEFSFVLTISRMSLIIRCNHQLYNHNMPIQWLWIILYYFSYITNYVKQAFIKNYLHIGHMYNTEHKYTFVVAACAPRRFKAQK